MLVVGSDYEQGPSLDPSTGPPLNSERRALHRRSIPQCGRALRFPAVGNYVVDY